MEMTSLGYSPCARALVAAALACAAALAAAAAGARAGDVAGRVKIGVAPAQEKNRKRYPVSAGGAVVEEAPVSANAVQEVILYLEGAGGGRGVHPTPSMRQRNKTFVPRVLPVKVGTTVEFPNLDPFYHNVFSYSKLKKFDLGRYSSGQSKSLTFESPGVVKVFCEIHSQMKGYIVVLDTDAFTLPDADGSFKIESVPAGKYTLVAWHPSFDPRTISVTVGAAGTSRVDVDF
jgi:plastocyanin